MHKYRSHNCNQLQATHAGEIVKLSGWIFRKRDHGNLLFVDLRDHYGITQLVFENTDLINNVDSLGAESVITVEGKVVMREKGTINSQMHTGEIEVVVSNLHVESEAIPLPFTLSSEYEVSEELRLKYRFLDLRRKQMHDNILLRSNVISYIRNLMTESGFTEFQTPILTASSPEGARDFLVPSRLHRGKFYALPQAPQQFKQLLMSSGFDKYFQIAPCFRDEDSRADRSPGEFYQLDIEMSFVTQEDVFAAIEPILAKVFTKFSEKKVTETPFPRITYADAMLQYGCDKPDLRIPIKICDVTDIFTESNFSIFKNNINSKNSVVRAIPCPNGYSMPRSFFDKMLTFAKDELGAGGLAYIQFNEDMVPKGPISKLLTEKNYKDLIQKANLKPNDAIFFACEKEKNACKIAGEVRKSIAKTMDLIEKDAFKFCWVVDFPYYEVNEDTGKIEFSHNPFSMPQGGMEAINNAKSEQDILNIKAYQYDIICNGIELSSGAIRNHIPQLLYKAFAASGYSKEDVDKEFSGMIKAMSYGAPPHGGLAPGIDRILMLLSGSDNIREVIAFPFNQKAQDLLMEAPSEVGHKHLQELGLKIVQNNS